MTSVSEPHIPDITTHTGLCDLMALGNLCILSLILDWRSYKNGLTKEEVDECKAARWHYEQMQMSFSKCYTITIGDSKVRPWSVFDRSLVEFAAAVVNQKYIYVDEAPIVEGCSASEVNSCVWDFVKESYSELEQC